MTLEVRFLNCQGLFLYAEIHSEIFYLTCDQVKAFLYSWSNVNASRLKRNGQINIALVFLKGAPAHWWTESGSSLPPIAWRAWRLPTSWSPLTVRSRTALTVSLKMDATSPGIWSVPTRTYPSVQSLSLHTTILRITRKFQLALKSLLLKTDIFLCKMQGLPLVWGYCYASTCQSH